MNWGEIAALGTWAGVLVALIGFLGLFRQLRLAAEQSRLEARSMTSNLYSHVSEANDRLNSRLLAQPELVPHFYENVPVPDGETQVQRQADLVCDTILDMADSIVEQRRARPDDMDWSTWWAYLRWLHDNAPPLRAALDGNVDFYPDYVFAVFGRIHVRENTSGLLKHIYQVWAFNPIGDDSMTDTRETAYVRKWMGLGDDDDLPHPGYPWVRTWLFYDVDPARGDARERGDDAAAIANVRVEPSNREHEDHAIIDWIETGGALDPDAKAAMRYWLLSTFDRTGVRWVTFAPRPQDGARRQSEPLRIDLSRKELDLHGPRYFARGSLPSDRRPRRPKKPTT